jgi:hypothetical protein
VVAPLRPVERERRVVLQRRPQLGRRRGHVLEATRHHSDDGVRVPVQRDLTADDRAVAAEAPPPQPVADDRHLRAGGHVLGGEQVAPERRLHAQHAEVARAHALTVESLGLGRPSHRRLPGPHHGERVEGAAPLDQLAVRAERDVQAGAVGAPVPDRHDPAGVRVRQRLE